MTATDPRIRRATTDDAGRLTALIHASNGYQGEYASIITHMLDSAAAEGIPEVRVVSNPPAERFYLSVGAERIGTIPPKPPRITWERPELLFRP